MPKEKSTKKESSADVTEDVEKKEKKPKKEKKTKKSKDSEETKAEEKKAEPPKQDSKIEVEDDSEEEKSNISQSESSATEAIKRDATKDTDTEEPTVDADELLDDENKAAEVVKKQKENIHLKENRKDKDLKRLKSKKDMTLRYADPEQENTIPFFKERECIMLLLEARMLLKEMVRLKLKQERIAQGNLSINEIQSLLRSQNEEEETDWVSEIQELKRNLVAEIRKNHVLERDLSKLDKRIALLIKNRGNIQEVLMHHTKPKKSQNNENKVEFVSDPRKLEQYQNLFYLLQTEPKYLANLVYLMQAEQMEAFLDTVILTLYGDAFSPREEYLILKLFSLAIQKQMTSVSKVSDFLKADSVVPKMVITYNRRKQGLEFLKTVVGPILKSFIAKGDVNLELNPTVIYQSMISEQEIRTGAKSTLERNLTADQIMELKEVQAAVKERTAQIEEICQQFLDGILQSISKLPYGIRYICKQIIKIAEHQFQNSAKDEIWKVIGYFIYYRFINLAIVTPDAFDVLDKELNPVARKNLVSVAKVLQNLFYLTPFGKNEKWFIPLNGWIQKRLDQVREYFTDIIEVAEPEDYLQVDKYMELTQKTKPLIIISLHEISQTHNFLLQKLDQLAKDKEDPLRIILNDLGEAPQISNEDDREIQLTLTNRFKQNMEDEISSVNNLYIETKEHIINTFRVIPIQNDEQDQTLLGILQAGKKYAKEKKDDALEKQIDKILENIKELEKQDLISKSDNYTGFLRDIALEVANRAEIREQQRKEIKRLNQTLRNLRKHQKYLTDQIAQYQKYLDDCREKHYQPKKKKKSKKKNVDNPNKIGPFKFSYNALAKKGVIIDSEVNALERKIITFEISSEKVGVFDIVAKIKSAEVERMTLELDDLLERNYNNITRLELDQVTLDVNMTIHLINKFFLK